MTRSSAISAVVVAVVLSAVSVAAAPTKASKRSVTLGAAPVALTTGGGSLWVLAEAKSSAVVLRIDAHTGHRLGRYSIGASGPDIGAIAVSAGRVWAVAGEHLLRIDLASRTVARTPLTGVGNGVAVGFGSVWVSTIGQRRILVVRLDARTLAVQARIPVGASGPHGLVSANGAVWTGEGALVLRINPSTDKIAARVSTTSVVVDLADARGQVWALGDGSAGTVRTGGPVLKASFPFSAAGFSVSGGRLWVIDSCGCRRGTLVEKQIPSGRTLARFTTGETPVAVIADATGAWVATFGDQKLTRFRG